MPTSVFPIRAHAKRYLAALGRWMPFAVFPNKIFIHTAEENPAIRPGRVKPILIFTTTVFIALSVIVTGLVGTAPVNAASASSSINFQARLENSSGAVAPDGTYNVEFKIYGTASGGVAEWTEDYTYNSGPGAGDARISVSNGYLTVSLGSLCPFTTGTCQGYPESAINWDQQQYLTMNIGGTGASGSFPTMGDGEMSPRLAITSVPYAFQARSVAQTDSSGNEGTLSFSSVTNNPVITLPNASGTVCLQGASTCGFATGSGTAFLQGGNSFGAQAELGTNDANSLALRTNNSDKLIIDTSGNITFQQASTVGVLTAASGAGYNLTLAAGMSGSGANSGGNLILQGGSTGGTGTTGSVIVKANGTDSNTAFQVQNASGNAILTINTTGNANLTVGNATNPSTITFVGGTTASRPASPTKGQLYFDTSTNQLLQYNGSKWVSAPKDATEIVAASNSTQTEKDAADYVATGTDDATTINSAISALPSGGGCIYLENGTYTLGTTSINVPDNVLIEGSGDATILQFSANVGSSTYYAIKNSDITTGNSVSVQNLLIDGNRTNQSAGTFYGIYLNHMGSGTGASAVQGGYVSNVTVKNIKSGDGISLQSSLNTTITGDTILNSTNGIDLVSASDDTITDNNTIGNTFGIFLSGAQNNTVSGNTTEGNSDGMYLFNSSGNNTVTGNTIDGNTSIGINITNSPFGNVISGNKIYDNGGTSFNEGISLGTSAVKNSITDNDITDTSCNTSCNAIDITDATSTGNYISGNHILGDGVHNAVIHDSTLSGTIYAGQELTQNGDADFRNTTNSTTAFQVQNASGASLLTADTSGNNVTIGVTGSINGKLTVASSHASGSYALQASASQANATTITLPTDANANDTFCLVTLSNCSGVNGGSGDTNYIENQTTEQTSANFFIQGTANSVTAKIQGASGSGDILDLYPNTGTSTPVVWVSSTGNLTVGNASNPSTITFVGGATASRPASPSKGQLYFDTSTNSLIQYNGTKWVSAPRTATEIVAANNSTQAEKDAADFVATGSGDQTTINSALNALPTTGGIVYLMEGTYTVSAAITIPFSNDTLSGSGSGTIITLPNAQNGSYSILTNNVTNATAAVTVQNLTIDGNKSNQTSGSMTGISLNSLGSGSGSSAISGAKLNNLIVKNIQGGDGIDLISSANATISNVTVDNNGLSGIYTQSSSNNTITGNTAQGNHYSGIELNTSSTNNAVVSNVTQGNTNEGIDLFGSSNYNTVSGNLAQSNGNTGILLNGSTGNTLTGNTAQGNTSNTGIDLVSSSNNNTVTGNTVVGNFDGIDITSSSGNSITANKIHDNGSSSSNEGITLSSGTNNSLTGNDITDTSCSSTCYALDIDSGSTGNYLSNNHIVGDGTHAATIHDATVSGNTYSGQELTQNGDASFRNASNSATALQIQNAAGTALLTADTQNQQVILRSGSSNATKSANLFTGFNTVSGWTNSGSGSSMTSTHTNGGGTTALTTTFIPTSGTTYEVSYNYSNCTSTNTLGITMGGQTLESTTSCVGFDDVVITATGTSALSFTPANTYAGTVSSVAIYAITQVNSVLTVQNSSATPTLQVRSSGSTSNLFIGLNSGQNNTSSGTFNTALGNLALQSNTTGVQNTALGSDALQNNTTGYNNNASGAYSLQANTTGNNDTASGSQALQSNTTGYQNTANGSNALQANTTGNNNTANGYGALQGNITGSNNTANGSSALQSNTTGSSNVANGFGSLMFNTTGSTNVANGTDSLQFNTTGSHNIADGLGTLQNNTTGSSNSATGYQALIYNGANNNNTANGYNALFSTTSSVASFGAITGGSGYTNGTYTNVTLTHSSGTFPITYPVVNITVSGGAVTAVTLVSGGVGIDLTSVFSANASSIGGTGSGFSVPVSSLNTGNGNAALGYQAGYSNTTGSNNSFFGYNAGYQDSNNNFATTATLQNATAIGAYAQVQANNSIVLGSVDTATSVGIGTTVPLNSFSVSPVDLNSVAVSASQTSGSGTITATSAIFSASNVGEELIWADGKEETITSYTDSTHVTGSSTSITETSSLFRTHHIGFQVTNAGNAYVQSSSATAFQIQNSNGAQVLGVDTTADQLNLSGNLNLAPVAAPASAPTFNSFVASGALSGTYYYVVTYVTVSGETNYSSAGSAITPVVQNVVLNIPTSPSGLVTARKIYRGVTNTGPFNLVGTVSDNTTTTFTDSNTSPGAAVSGINSTATLKVGGITALIVDNINNNVALGQSDLQLNTTGLYNTAIGYQALQANTTGNYNMALGTAALNANTSGSYNTAIGLNALTTNTSGNYNTGLGLNALTNNTTGTYNTGIGVAALSSTTTGSYNTGIGEAALYNNTTGSKNVAIGYHTGYQDYGTTGANGRFAMLSTIQNATAIGAYAQVQENNAIVLGSVDNATNVGIGTTVPLNPFSVSPVDLNSNTITASQASGSGTITANSSIFSSSNVGEEFIWANGTQETITAYTDATHITGSNTTITETNQYFRTHHIGLQVTSSGDTYVQNSSTTTFQVQNAAGTSNLFVADTTDSTIGINVAPTSTGGILQVAGTASDVSNGSLINVSGTLASTTNNQTAIRSVPTISPGSAVGSSVIFSGANFTPTTSSSNINGGGASGLAGFFGGSYYTGTGTLSNAYGAYLQNSISTAGTITNSYGLYVENPIKTAGTITNNYGIYVNGQSNGSTNYAIYSQGGQNFFGGNVNTTGVYQQGGTSGINLTCTGTQAVNGMTIKGGIITAGTCALNAADYAEAYNSTDTLKPGEIVATDPTNYPNVLRSTSANQANIIGVVSTNPYQVIGTGDAPNGYPIALNGRVPVKVNMEGGVIHPGDKITSSSVAGVGMKATTAGMVIGTALTGYDGSQTSASVEVFVHTSYYDPTSGSSIQGSDASFTTLNVSGTATINALTVESETVVGSLTVHGLTNVADLEVSGHIITAGGQPTVQLEAALGAGATASINGNDTTGTVTITTGTNGLSAGDLLQMVFSKSYGAAPHVVLSPSNDAASTLHYFKGATSATGFTLDSHDVPAANTFYQFDYFIAQ